MLRRKKDGEPSLQDDMEHLELRNEMRDPANLDLPAAFTEIYSTAEDETVPPLMIRDPDLKDFRFVINRLTRLTKMNRNDKELIMLRLRIIAQEMMMMWPWRKYEKNWKKVELMLEHAELTLFDSIGGWKLDKITERRRTVRVGKTEEPKRKWF